MSSVYFDPIVGGDGSTVTDDSNATTGLANGGHRSRFVPALAQLVAVADYIVTYGITATDPELNAIAGLTSAANKLPYFTGSGTAALTDFGSAARAFLATPSSANLIALLSDETGSGSAVFATSPTLVTPVLGVASATSINKVAITAPATSSTITIADGKTLTASNTLTFTGTDSSSIAFGAGGTVLYSSNIGTSVQAYDADLTALAGVTSAADKVPYFTGSGTATTTTLTTFGRSLIDDADASTARATLGLTIGTNVQAYDADLTTWAGVTPASGMTTFLATPSSANLKAAVTDETGSGALVFATSPTLVTPELGAATSADQTLNAISTTISGTAVAPLVYDTRDDSDGGAWRKRCQHTSWYNETLNTATRGATREFPAVALIIATSSSVTIYDATVSSCPMWMVFNIGGSGASIALFTAVGRISASANITCINMVNGELIVGCAHPSGTGGGLLNRIRFISEKISHHCDAAIQNGSSNGIADRNSYGNVYIDASVGSIVQIDVQCITATVLPTAPIDNATGLPISTVWVGTLGGVSRIAHDGTVSNWTDTSGASAHQVTKISIISDYVYWSTNSAANGIYCHQYPITLALSTWAYNSIAYEHYSSLVGEAWQSYRTPLNYSALSSTNHRAITFKAIATQNGLFALKPNTTDWGKGLHATITKDFNTGYQYGDIRGAWLCNATAETLTATSLVTGDSSTFTSGVGSWVAGNAESTIAAVSGKLEVTALGTNASTTCNAKITLTLIVGKTYVFTADIEKISGRGSPTLQISNISAFLTVSNTVVGTSTISTSLTAVNTYCDLSIYEGTTTEPAGLSFRVDNVTVKLADPDYSYKNQALEVVGSLTKAAVASGAELMAYSGFSSTNYLYAPYSSNLDFGTGDFHISYWLKMTPNSTDESVLERDSVASSKRIHITINGGGYLFFVMVDGSTTRFAYNAAKVVDDSLWHKYDCVYNGAGALYIYQDNQLYGSATGAAMLTMTNATANLVVGNDIELATPLTHGSLALLHISAGAPSAAQIKAAYEAEKPLFQANAKCLLAGTSNDVKAVDYDSATGIHHAVTGDYYSVFKGLQRVDSASGVWTSVNAENGLVIKGN